MRVDGSSRGVGGWYHPGYHPGARQAITAAPKIALVFLLLIFGGPMMMKVLKDYMYDSVHGIDIVNTQPGYHQPCPASAWLADVLYSKGKFFNDHNAPPGQSKLKQFINSPLPPKNLTTTDKAILSAKSESRHPSWGSAKKSMKRRNDNTLPKPPKRQRGNPNAPAHRSVIMAASDDFQLRHQNAGRGLQCFTTT
ncbi:MAG: hypothetical protein R2857_01250 [Vampirovibrionales bacterium]